MFRLTKRTESRVAIVSISAHDTIPLHALSTAVLMVSTTSNPLAELRFGNASFSLSSPSRNMDPSQPFVIQNQLYVNVKLD